MGGVWNPATAMSHPTDPTHLLRRATQASVATALLLVAIKLAGWLTTDAVSLLASLVDSLMDAAASTINLLAVRYSLQPADADHRFGHGKSEALAALVQAFIIGGSAIYLLINAVDRLLHPQPLTELTVGLVVMLISIAATALLLRLQRRAIQHTGSAAIRADSLHYLTDLLSNLAVVVALLLSAAGWSGADPLFAIAIGLYILWSARSIARDAYDILMDRELPQEVQQQVRRLALAQPEVSGIHDLRTRQSGLTKIIQLHIELRAELPLGEAHAIARRIQHAIVATYPGADVIIHQDPVEPE